MNDDKLYFNLPAMSPNILFLETSKLANKEELIEEYYEILQTCHSKTEICAVLSMLFEEVTERTGKLIIERQIIDKVRQLHELRSSSEY